MRALDVFPQDEEKAAALALLARWERVSVEEYCRMAVQAAMRGSLDDLRAFATGSTGKSDRREIAWAQEFIGAVEPLMRETAGGDPPAPSGEGVWERPKRAQSGPDH